MTPGTLFLVYLVAGSIALIIALRIFGARFELWQPIAASALAALSVFIVPRNFIDLASLVIVVGFLKAVTREEWANIVYPVLITRLVLFGVMTFVLLSSKVSAA
jgi:hypothetical protein